MDLYNFNEWWKTGNVPSALVGKRREVFHEVTAYLDAHQILLFTGLRRVGKTTLMFQLIDELLKKKVNPYRILYFSFDETRYDLDRLIDEYSTQVLKEDIAERRTYIFLDEIQKLKNWPAAVKLLYDMNTNIKIFLTGSAQVNVWKDVRESLAGRFFDFVIRPLDFDEFLKFKDVGIDRERENIFEQEIKRLFQEHLKTGGFIEAIGMDDMILRKYLKESLLERVVFIDIPGAFKLDMPELLYRLLTILSSRPGMYVDYKNIGNDLKIDHRTISLYLSYLEYALFLQKLYNYSPNLLTSEKKIKRFYLSNTAFTLSLNPDVDFSGIMEQYFANLLKTRFFLRTPQKEEIDIIHVHDGNILPVEIKMREKIDNKDVKFLWRFMETNRLEKSLLISLQTESVLQKTGKAIHIIPYWKYWTIMKQITFG